MLSLATGSAMRIGLAPAQISFGNRAEEKARPRCCEAGLRIGALMTIGSNRDVSSGRGLVDRMVNLSTTLRTSALARNEREHLTAMLEAADPAGAPGTRLEKLAFDRDVERLMAALESWGFQTVLATRNQQGL